MTEPTLNALRADVQTLSPIAARTCCMYLPAITLPDTSMSALLRDLDTRADSAPWPDFDSLVAEIGRPGHWRPAAFQGDAMDARLWLAGVQALAVQHAPKPPPVD